MRTLLALATVTALAVSPAAHAAPSYVGGGQHDLALAQSFTEGVQRFAAKQRAHASFKRFVRSSDRNGAAYKAAKEKHSLGIVRAANTVSIAANATEYGMAGALLTADGHTFEKAAVIGLSLFSSGLVKRALKTESQLRVRARTETVARAIARGEGPSSTQLAQWISAGIVLPIRK